MAYSLRCAGNPCEEAEGMHYHRSSDTYQDYGGCGDSVSHSTLCDVHGGEDDFARVIADREWVPSTEPPLDTYPDSLKAEEDEYHEAEICDCIKFTEPNWRIIYLNHWLQPPLVDHKAW